MREMLAESSEIISRIQFTRRGIFTTLRPGLTENMGSYNSTAALIKLFDEQGVSYIVQWASDEPSRLVGLV